MPTGDFKSAPIAARRHGYDAPQRRVITVPCNGHEPLGLVEQLAPRVRALVYQRSQRAGIRIKPVDLGRKVPGVATHEVEVHLAGGDLKSAEPFIGGEPLQSLQKFRNMQVGDVLVHYPTLYPLAFSMARMPMFSTRDEH